MIIHSHIRAFKNRLAKLPLARLANDDSGLALTEFAFVAPFFLTIGLVGTDTASFAIAHMRVSQIAVHVADNASRVGENDVLVARRVTEANINDLFIGAERYAGGLNLATEARVILSSLQLNAEGGQWIQWQRCFGSKPYLSSFGFQGTGATGTSFPGMGQPGREITATPGNAVMFVEVALDYSGLGPISFADGEEIVYTAAFNVRDNRDLTQIYQTSPASPVATCLAQSIPVRP